MTTPTATTPLRVLLLCERLDLAGGVERFVCTLAGHLAGQGMQVAVGSVSTERAQIPFDLPAGVRVLGAAGKTHEPDAVESGRRRTPLAATSTASLLGRGRRAWRLLHAQWRVGGALGRLIARERPDVVVLNGLVTACSVLLRKPGCAGRVIACDHNHVGARSALWRGLRALLYPRVAAVVSLTEADAPAFRALNRRTLVIANASALRADAPALVPQPIALAVARHVAQKGIDLLLQAWVDVVRVLPEARLWVVGDGPLLASTQALAGQLGIADSIRWLPPTTEIEAVYRAAALFVLPSRYEGMPLALLEAQALGLPAIAFDCPTGPRDIVTPDTGVLVAPGDVEAFGHAMLCLLRNPLLRARMAAAALERSRAVFGVERHLQRWTDLVREVGLRRRRPQRGTP